MFTNEQLYAEVFSKLQKMGYKIPREDSEALHILKLAIIQSSTLTLMDVTPKSSRTGRTPEEIAIGS